MKIKNILLGIGLSLAGLCSTQAQNGIDSIYVEKYYIANTADNAGSVGNLPVGSVTYRLFVCMKPGYKFQMAYGDGNHSLKLTTTTSFFNNEDNGQVTVPSITTTKDGANTNMLDSWVSSGSALGTTQIGVPKSEDNNGTIAHTLLQNTNPKMGILLTAEDGMIPGTPEPVAIVGDASSALSILGATSQAGNSVVISNGSWYCNTAGGTLGPNATNRVLIAQITTDGIFHYELNVQVGTPTGGTQSFVSSNPQAGELTIPSMQGSYGKANVAPTVKVTVPSSGNSYKIGSIVKIKAFAKDSLATDSAVGALSSVAFYDGATLIGTVSNSTTSATDSVNWNTTGLSLGVHTLTAKATDNEGAQTSSSSIFETILSNKLPYVHITTDSSTVNQGHIVTITAVANDTDGTVSKVDFYNGATLLGTSNGPSYSYAWHTTLAGTYTLTAKATDDNNGVGTSNAISFVVKDTSSNVYKIDRTIGSCSDQTFLVPVEKINTKLSNCIGFDITMNYNNSKVVPTGNVVVHSALIDSSLTSYSVNISSSSINISVYLNSYATSSTAWDSLGKVFSVEFSKLSGFTATDSVQFTVPFLMESYKTSTLDKSGKVTPGYYVSKKDSIFNGYLKLWSNNNPIVWDINNPSAHLATNIYGNLHPTTNAARPDMNGVFNYSINNGSSITIKKDINDTTTVMPVINGYDAYLVQKVLVNYVGYVPNVYQMIAMDVNRDGKISAGDLSQINQRTVKTIGHFAQTTTQSQDWLFENLDTIQLSKHYKKSSSYPNDDNVGYSKFRVPQVDTLNALPISGTTSCPVIGSKTYMGILLGDANGNYATISTNDMKLSNNKVVFDLSNAVKSGNFIDVPVSILSNSDVNALDFSSKLNNVSFVSVTDNTNTLNMMSNVTADNTLLFTSSSLTNYATSPISVRFTSNNGTISNDDLSSVSAYVNGDAAEVLFSTNGVNEISNDQLVSVYPVPAKDQINVLVSKKSSVQLMDLSGKLVMTVNANANQLQVLNVQDLTAGIYIMKISNEKSSTMKKVVITK